MLTWINLCPLSHLGIESLINKGPVGDLVADAYCAETVTIGTQIFALNNVAPRVLRHELAHAAQSTRMGPPSSRVPLEQEAHEAALLPIEQQSATSIHFSAPIGLPLFPPALRTLLRAGSWLARRSTNTISKHVARHGRRIAGRAVPAIFRQPRHIRYKDQNVCQRL